MHVVRWTYGHEWPNIAKLAIYCHHCQYQTKGKYWRFGKQPYLPLIVQPSVRLICSLQALWLPSLSLTLCSAAAREEPRDLNNKDEEAKVLLRTKGQKQGQGMAVWVSCLFSMVISNSCCVALYSFFSTTLPNHQNLITLFDTVLILAMTSIVNILVRRVLQ